jgi:hypothetical protein
MGGEMDLSKYFLFRWIFPPMETEKSVRKLQEKSEKEEKEEMSPHKPQQASRAVWRVSTGKRLEEM